LLKLGYLASLLNYITSPPISQEFIILRVQFFIFYLLGLLLLPGNLLAYSSVTVPINQPVYRQLDKLAAHGLIKTMIVGQRPYVRYEIARLIGEALKNYPDFEAQYRDVDDLSLKESQKRLSAKVYVDRLLKELKKNYHEELVQRGVLEGIVPPVQGKLLEYIQGQYVYLDEPKGRVPPNNGIGGVDAIVQPLVEKRGGRHYQSGSNWSFETMHWVRLGKYFAFQAQPRFQFQIAQGDRANENGAYVQRLNGHFTWKKLDLEIGRDSIVYGPSAKGGLTFSTNPRPLDFIKLSSISPFYYPFFFRKLGLNQMSLVVANLGPDQIFSEPWLVVWKISNKRTEHFEFGMTQVVEMGGDGAPDTSFTKGFIDFWDLTQNNERSSRTTTIELIGRISQLRGMEIYAEILFSDFTTNMNTLWVDNTSYLVGVHLPRLNYVGTLDLRLEYRRMAPRYARSPVFTDGFTENQLLIGDPLGPDAQGVELNLQYEMTPKNLLSFGFQFRRRNNNIYQVSGNSIDKIASLGQEDRFLYHFGLRHLFNKHFVGHVAVGLEQVHNANFVTGDNVVNWLGEAGFTVYIDPVAGL